MKYDELSNNAGLQRVFRSRYKLDQPGLISHITQRAAGMEPLFLEESDYLTMLGLLKKSAEKYQIKYLALCCMQNHIHILIQPEEKNLYASMHYIFSSYAHWFNKKYQRKGHLFGGPYRQSVCLNPAYLLAASVYIHLNPVRAGLVKDPSKYRWSSWGLYCKQDSGKSFIDPGPVLDILDKDKNIAVKQYEMILREGADAKQDNSFEKKGAVEKFCFILSEMFPTIFKRISKAWSSCNEDQGQNILVTPVEQLTMEFQDFPATRQPETRKARKYIVQQLLARGFKKTEIAAQLNISRCTVYNILNSRE